MKAIAIFCVCSLFGFSAFKTEATEIIINDFSNPTNLTRNGSAVITNTADGAVMRLVRAVAGQSGNFFTTQPINAYTFSATFKFRITDIGGGVPNFGADGIAF